MNTIYNPKRTPAQIAAFARDMAIYGDSDAEGVCAAHNISLVEATELVNTPLYNTEYTRVSSQLTDPHAAIRIKAQNILPSTIDVIAEIVNDKYQPAAARLKAAELTQKLAGVADNEAANRGQVVLQLNFGGLVQTPEQFQPAVEVVVDTPPTLTKTDDGWDLE